MYKLLRYFLICSLPMFILVGCGDASPTAISDELQSLIDNNENPRLIDQEFRSPSHNQYLSFPIDNDALAAITVDEDLAEGIGARLYADNILFFNPNRVTVTPDTDAGAMSDEILSAILSEYSLDGFNIIIVRSESQNCSLCKFRYNLEEKTREQLDDYRFNDVPTLTPSS